MSIEWVLLSPSMTTPHSQMCVGSLTSNWPMNTIVLSVIVLLLQFTTFLLQTYWTMITAAMKLINYYRYCIIFVHKYLVLFSLHFSFKFLQTLFRPVHKDLFAGFWCHNVAAGLLTTELQTWRSQIVLFLFTVFLAPICLWFRFIDWKFYNDKNSWYRDGFVELAVQQGKVVLKFINMELPDIKYSKAEYIETVSFIFFSVTITTVWIKNFRSYSVY